MLVIFDWDGTLINSLAKITQCMQLAAVDAGLAPRSESEIHGIIGLGIPQALAILYPDVPHAPLDSLRDRYSHHFITKDQNPCEFYPGVGDTLAELKSGGHHIAVATGKSRRGLDRVLGNLGWENYFHATRCADETLSKPDPLMLSEIMSELDYGVEDAVMVGDTEFDLEMASRLGMRRVGVSYGAHSPERLSLHQPEVIIDHINDILRIIE
ncbi:MAG: HAD family hydrolase [Gammaproteobacteria bacterium]|jgi:phosphoglycolate phosphatase